MRDPVILTPSKAVLLTSTSYRPSSLHVTFPNTNDKFIFSACAITRLKSVDGNRYWTSLCSLIAAMFCLFLVMIIGMGFNIPVMIHDMLMAFSYKYAVASVQLPPVNHVIRISK